MFRNPGFRLAVLAVSGLYFALVAYAAPVGGCQIAEPPEKPDQHQHHSGPHIMMNIPDTSGQKCEPKFTYVPGPHDPSHWESVCSSGKMQSPIDITHSEKLRLPPIAFSYQPADLAVFNDCNEYEIKLLFTNNYWLKVGKKPYFLSNLHFHEPGEFAVNGKRPAMVVHLVHLSPESTFLVVEIPVVVGKENPVIRTLWNHIPPPGKEKKFSDVKINVMDLLPADRDYYRVPGSLDTPVCNEGVTWFVLKNPIEMSAAQIAEYKKHYHDTARPLQPANDRPVAEPFVKATTSSAIPR
jgi:carbonic anhydrase